MNRIHEYRAAFFILGSGVLGAVAIVLIPGLFEEFRTGRLVTILGLTAGAVGLAIAAKWSRRRITSRG